MFWQGRIHPLKDASDLTFLPPPNGYILNTAVLWDLQVQCTNTGYLNTGATSKKKVLSCPVETLEQKVQMTR